MQSKFIKGMFSFRVCFSLILRGASIRFLKKYPKQEGTSGMKSPFVLSQKLKSIPSSVRAEIVTTRVTFPGLLDIP